MSVAIDGAERGRMASDNRTVSAAAPLYVACHRGRSLFLRHSKRLFMIIIQCFTYELLGTRSSRLISGNYRWLHAIGHFIPAAAAALQRLWSIANHRLTLSPKMREPLTYPPLERQFISPRLIALIRTSQTRASSCKLSSGLKETATRKAPPVADNWHISGIPTISTQGRLRPLNCRKTSPRLPSPRPNCNRRLSVHCLAGLRCLSHPEFGPPPTASANLYHHS